MAAEWKTGKKLTSEQLNDTWEWAQSTGRIGNKQPIQCGVKRDEAFSQKCCHNGVYCAHWNDCKFNCNLDGASIATRFLRLLGDKGYFVEVGTADIHGNIKFYPNSKTKNYDFGIQKIRQGGPQQTHFVLVNRMFDTVEDPHDPPIAKKETVEYPLGVIYTVLYAYVAGE